MQTGLCPMTEKPNCTNCPHAQNLGDDETPAMYCAEASKHNYIMECDYEDTQLRGCMWHPGAREWLMRDVIEKLEQISKLELVEEQECYIDGIREAIALIKGVKE